MCFNKYYCSLKKKKKNLDSKFFFSFNLKSIIKITFLSTSHRLTTNNNLPLTIYCENIMKRLLVYHFSSHIIVENGDVVK